MDSALRMPLDERQRRHAILAATVAGTTPTSWAAGFLGQLGGRPVRVS
jgi:trehalose-6-phosphate synthase